METKSRFNRNDKDFDTVKTFREIKENISKDIWGLSYENFMKYLENTKRKKIQNTTEIIYS
jgi:hypothetical protein